MNGVEILVFEEVACAYESWNWQSFWIAVAIAFVVSLFAGFIFTCLEDSVGSGLVMFGLTFIIVSLILCMVLATNNVNPTKYETQYKVTIDDSVSMTEFNEKYEVIEQEGKIYTVREKHQEYDFLED